MDDHSLFDYPTQSPAIFRFRPARLRYQPGFDLDIIVAGDAQGQPVTKPPARPVRSAADYVGGVQPVSARAAHLATEAGAALNQVLKELVACSV